MNDELKLAKTAFEAGRLQEAETRAALAAVNAARRGISAAWASTIINALVVGVALFLPTYQIKLEDGVRQERHDQFKASAVSSLYGAYNRLTRDMRQIEIDRELNHPETGAYDIAHRTMLAEQLNGTADYLDKQAQMIAALYPDDFSDVRFLATTIATVDMNVGQIFRQLAMEVKAAPELSAEDFDAMLTNARRDMLIQIEDLKVLADANADPKTGKAKPGDAFFTNCLMKENFERCARAGDAAFKELRERPISSR